MKKMMSLIAIVATISSGKLLASPPPFVCSIYAATDIATNKNLTENEKTTRRLVIELFDNAEQGSGPVLELLNAEISRTFPTVKLSTNELADEINKINFTSYSETPCFEMITKGINFSVQLFNPEK